MNETAGERTVGRVNSLSHNSNDPNSFLASLPGEILFPLELKREELSPSNIKRFFPLLLRYLYQLKYSFLKSFNTRISILNKEGNEGRNIAYENLN